MTKNEVIMALDKARAAIDMKGVTVRSLEMKLPDGKVIVFSNEQPAPDFPLTGFDVSLLDAAYADIISMHENDLSRQLEAIQDQEAAEEAEKAAGTAK